MKYYCSLFDADFPAAIPKAEVNNIEYKFDWYRYDGMEKKIYHEIEAVRMEIGAANPSDFHFHNRIVILQ